MLIVPKQNKDSSKISHTVHETSTISNTEHEASPTDGIKNQSEHSDCSGMLCAVCFANPKWISPLIPNSHGCTKCHNIFDSKHWSKDVIKHHRSRPKNGARDLVCAECAKKGFSSGKYDEYECHECNIAFGSLKFNKQSLVDFKREKNSVLKCEDCAKKIKCGACKIAFDKNYWTAAERKFASLPKRQQSKVLQPVESYLTTTLVEHFFHHFSLF